MNFKVRSFFSVIIQEYFGKICLQGCFKRVFELSFTAVRKAVPSRMPEGTLARGNPVSFKNSSKDGVRLPSILDLVSVDLLSQYFYAGSNPAVNEVIC